MYMLLGGSLLLLLVAGYFALCIRKQVLQHSVPLQQLQQINEDTHFRTIREEPIYCHICQSRGEFNRLSLEKYFLEVAAGERTHFEKIIKDIEYNKRAFSKYGKKVENVDLRSSDTTARQLKIPVKLWRYCQGYLFRRMLLAAPAQNIEILCRKEYTSPAGRSHTRSDIIIDFWALKDFLQEAAELEAQRELRQNHAQRERALMTNSLRYDIMRRDGFCCQLCGSAASDGVKLHIDHIIPVSRGGCTTPENLRTLCDRCNSGKRDKIE